MKVIKPSYLIETPINGDDVLKHLERAGRTCYKSEDRITASSAREFVSKYPLGLGHETILEHFSVTVRIVCDRGVSHELVRHRLASYSQESTRYCNYGKANKGCTFILPTWINQGVGEYDIEWDGCFGNPDSSPYVSGSAENVWFWTCAVSERDYLKLLDLGWTPQQARSVLPNSLKTEVVMTCNIREWRHFFKQRTAKQAFIGMREVTIPMLSEFKKLMPVLFDDIIVQEDAIVK